MMSQVSSRVVALCYHSVHPTTSFAISPELFEQHLAWLREHCDLIPFRQLVDVAHRARGARPAASVTFDDGHVDNFEYAFPLLQAYRVPATFFLTVGLLERDPVVVARFQKLRRASYDEIRPLTWAQVREMRRNGIEVGAHTYSHPNLARLGRAAAEHELGWSKTLIEARLGERVTLVAYPFGAPGRHFTRETVAIVSQLGYEYAAATTSTGVRCSHSRYAIPRFFGARDDVGGLRDKVLGAYDLLGVWQERAPVLLQRGLDAIAGTGRQPGSPAGDHVSAASPLACTSLEG